MGGAFLSKLEKYGFRGKSLAFFRSFFSDRFQCVEVDGVRSDLHPINTGIFQGSTLGPLFYLIFCNDMGNLPLSGKLNLFADDTGYFVAGRTVVDVIEKLQKDLSMIFAYFRVNKLSVNVSKTNILFFRTPNRTIPSDLRVVVDGMSLPISNQATYLGVILDECLSWKQNVDDVGLKLSKSIGIFRKLSHTLPRDILRTIYFAFVHCHFIYCCLVWGTAFKTNLEDLQVLQNRAVKCLLHLPILTSSTDVYRLAGIPTIKQIYYKQLGLFMFDEMNRNIFTNIQFSVTATTTRNVSVRSKFARTVTGQRNVLSEGPRLYNMLPNEIKSKTSREGFKQGLSDWLNDSGRFERCLRDFSLS